MSQLASVLGDDYDRKMAVVAVLKQYAEDRDIDILCRSLAAILQTPHQRTIIRYIRCVHAGIYLCFCVRLFVSITETWPNCTLTQKRTQSHFLEELLNLPGQSLISIK